MNINQQRQENRQDFQIDQNEQNINRLRKKTKELSDGFDALSQSASVSQTDIASLKTDVATAKSDIAELKSLGSTTEEKVELASYDCYKTKDRIYRDTCWLPRPIGFVAESGKMFKFRVKFDAVSSFTTTITSTAKITFDEEEIYSDTKEIPAGGTHAVDFEYITSSERAGHKLIIELRNTETPARRTNCCIPEFLTVELWGTNVQFVSRNNDFCVIPAGNNVVMTTTVFDNTQAMFSMQPADANLSFEQSAFKFLKTNDYRDYNQVIPMINVVFDEEKNMTYSTKPSLIVYNIQTDATDSRVAYYIDADGNNAKTINPSGIAFLNSYLAKGLMTNSNNKATVNPITDMFGISNDGSLLIKNKGMFLQIVLDMDADRYENFDGCGVLRLDNSDDKTMYYGVATRKDGISYFWSSKANDIEHSKVMLGFGTHSNAYLLANNQIVVFLRVGKNTKKITLELDGSPELFYHVISTEIIPDCQEYWLTPNGSHFERCGNKIKYFLADSTTPAKTLTMFC